MATQPKTAPDKPQPQSRLMKLSEESLNRLKSTGEGSTEVYKALDSLEKIGMDVRVLRDKFDWAMKTREILLKNFEPDPEDEE